ncbi:MAG TPA: hypothetical protein VN495_00935 [Candidatus Paceibacterota bacterium]|nr:hypothetical protein [Candidatus Paceibacterota bacterium]
MLDIQPRPRVRKLLRRLASTRPKTFKKPGKIAVLEEINDGGLCRFVINGNGPHRIVQRRRNGKKIRIAVYLTRRGTESI